jgi:hypothetical protein
MYIGIIVYTEMASVRVQFESLGTDHYFWRWVVPKKNVFLVKNVLIQPLKSQKNVLPNLKYQLKNKYPLLAKTFTKGYHSVVTHVLYHCLCNFLQYKFSRCLHMYFLWRHHLPPDKSGNDQDSGSD